MPLSARRPTADATGRILAAARSHACRLGDESPAGEHLLLAALDEREGRRLVVDAGGDVALVRAACERDGGARRSGGPRRALASAWETASARGVDAPDSGDVVLGLLAASGAARAALLAGGTDEEVLRRLGNGRQRGSGSSWHGEQPR